MFKTAVLIYDGFCLFEIASALEILALNNRKIDVFATCRSAYRTEEGITVVPDKTIHEFNENEYDSLIIPGGKNIGEVVAN